MPTIYREGNFRFFFNSREETRRHIHINSPDGTAKFWLEPFIELADYYGMDERSLGKIEKIVIEKQEAFIHAWDEHFKL